MDIAGLAAQGRTQVEDMVHVWRGYEAIDVKLRSLGGSFASSGFSEASGFSTTSAASSASSADSGDIELFDSSDTAT